MVAEPVPTALPQVQAEASYGDRGRGLTFWCGWCGTSHVHGAGYGMRARHCRPGSGEPFGSYVLAEGPRGCSEAPHLSNTFPLQGGLRLASPALRAIVAHAIVGTAAASRRLSFVKRLGLFGEVTVRAAIGAVTAGLGRHPRPHDTWSIKVCGGPHLEGEGMLDFAQAAQGVSPGVLAVRVIEAALGITLDGLAARQVYTALEDWTARGRPGADDTRTGPRA